MTFRIALIIGDQKRHLYLASRLRESPNLAGVVVQKRNTDLPAMSELALPLQKLASKHFENRAEAEERFFEETGLPDCPTFKVTPTTLNSRDTAEFLKSLSADLVVSWGCNLLSQALIETTNVDFWNIHGGLSPRYRGSATLFWPCFFLEPNWLGLTTHQTTQSIDGGDVIHQTPADLVAGDGLQMHSARAVHKGLSEFVKLLSSISSSGIPIGVRQRSAGKLFLTKDWRPEHLRLIYEVYHDKLVDAALQGEINPPPLTGLTSYWKQRSL